MILVELLESLKQLKAEFSDIKESKEHTNNPLREIASYAIAELQLAIDALNDLSVTPQTALEKARQHIGNIIARGEQKKLDVHSIDVGCYEDEHITLSTLFDSLDPSSDDARTLLMDLNDKKNPPPRAAISLTRIQDQKDLTLNYKQALHNMVDEQRKKAQTNPFHIAHEESMLSTHEQKQLELQREEIAEEAALAEQLKSQTLADSKSETNSILGALATFASSVKSTLWGSSNKNAAAASLNSSAQQTFRKR